MAIKLITDTSSDLTKTQAEKYDIMLLPLLVYIDEKEYKDNEGISTDDIIEAMLEGKKVYTGQIPPASFLDTYEKLAKTDDSYIFIPISSQTSGTYTTAVSTLNMFKEDHPDFDMTIVDGRCISMGLGLLMIELSKKLKEGLSKEELIEFALSYGPKIEHLFTVDKLDWLLEGGRVTKTQAFMGNLLNIKPILYVVDGVLTPFEKERGNKKKIQKLKKHIKENSVDLSNKIVAITHAGNIKEAKIMAEFFKDELKAKEVIINNLGSVITAHCGPGLLSVFYDKH